MKYIQYIPVVVFTAAILTLCSCTIFYGKQSAATPEVQSTPKPLAVPVGKNWQVTEEPPKLSNETGRLPFQLEQSLQPEVAKPVSPVDNRKIETTR
jgi:hypothetical protein